MKAFCAVDDIADPGAKGPFRVEIDGEKKTIFIVKRDGEIHAYVNSCPHVGAPLEMEEDGFLDLDRSTILCTVHGARFAIETGQCVMGPCANKALRRYPVHVLNGRIMPGPSPKGL